MRSKSRFTTLVLLESRESCLQIRVPSQNTRTLLARKIALVSPRHNFIRSDVGIEGIETLREADAQERKAPGGDQIAPPGCVQAGAKIRRGQQFAVDRTAHRRDAADLVDRRPHNGEIEAVLAADVAIKHLADMQPDIGRRRRPAIAAAAGVERSRVAPETMLRPQRGAPG